MDAQKLPKYSLRKSSEKGRVPVDSANMCETPRKRRETTPLEHLNELPKTIPIGILQKGWKRHSQPLENTPVLP